MSFPLVIFSPSETRGDLLSQAFQKSGYEVALYKDLHAAENVLKTKLPSLVILDKKGYFANELKYFVSLHRLLNNVAVLVVTNLVKEGYFANELKYFSSLNGLLNNVSVLGVANSLADGSLSLKDVRVEWCLSNPLDPLFIVSKAKKLLTVTGRGDSFEKETLAKDLRGFLGLE